jgi:uncharacterized membrane protein SpoIIM required for sporulation
MHCKALALALVMVLMLLGVALLVEAFIRALLARLLPS